SGLAKTPGFEWLDAPSGHRHEYLRSGSLSVSLRRNRNEFDGQSHPWDYGLVRSFIKPPTARQLPPDTHPSRLQGCTRNCDESLLESKSWQQTPAPRWLPTRLTYVLRPW